MSTDVESISRYIESLESEAEEIEALAEEYFSDVERHVTKIHSSRSRGSGKEYEWSTLDDSTKPLQRKIRRKYEQWYNKASPLVNEFLSSRYSDFSPQQKLINRTVNLSRPDPADGTDAAFRYFIDRFDIQRNILNAIPARVEAQKLSVRRRLSKRIGRDEIQRARELLDEEFTRASGVVAAVALERHLLTMCENSNEVTEFNTNHGINRLSQTLYEADEIDKTTWNDLKALASIRETCAHPEEPNEAAVRRLIEESEEFIRELRI
ncbi:hypothetical protein [Natrialba asiatica]|uniref:hypothetical protein n=1 Tax=Natrialba asiatica TaxID=64602 RepID=UPI0012683BB2|nr:hypothetical protein [Natrialba asiatica]